MSAGQRDGAFVASVVLGAVALAATLWMWGLPISNDGPTHVFQAWVRNHYHDPAFGYEKYYRLLSPVTAGIFVEVQCLLEPLFGWRTAWRLNVIIASELWAFGFLLFVWALAPARRAVGLLGFGLALQTLLWLGTMPFLYGSALSWYAIAWWLRARGSARQHVVLALMLWLIAYAHIVAAALAGITVAIITLSNRERRAWPAALLKLTGVAVPALSVVWRSAGIANDAALSRGMDGEPVPPNWLPTMDRLLVVGTWFQSGPPWRALFATLLVAAGVWAAAARARRGALSSSERAIVLVAFVLLCTAPALPEHIGGWQMAGLRIMPLAVGGALAFLPMDDGRALVRRVVALAIALYVVTSMAWALHFEAAVKRVMAPVLAGLTLPVEPMDRGYLLTAHLLDPPEDFPVTNFVPTIAVGNLYALARGGLDHYGHHDAETIHQIGIKPEYAVEVPNVDLWPGTTALRGTARRDQIRKLLARLSTFDGLVMVGMPEDLQQAVDAGFAPELMNERLLVARNAGCSGRMELLDTADDAPFDIEVGWWPSRVPTALYGYKPGVGAPTAMPLPRFGCGEVWLFPRGSHGERCAAAGAGMPVRAVFSPGDENVLRCSVVTAPPAP